MKESNVESLASYGGPESCVHIREGVGEALTGVRAGRGLVRSGYLAKPVKRVYVDKADGSKRPLGVPALEDKIVQRAAVKVLDATYEQDFLGSSYGFRPGKGARYALDAVEFGVVAGKFMVLRLTSAKRLRAKLHAVKDETRRRMHRSIAEPGQHLRAMAGGHARRFGVPSNGARLSVFRFQVARL